jgi:hypothetical protein
MLVSNEDEKFGWIRSDEEEDLERISRPDAEDEGEHKKPRGRPFSRGRSGNPAGRPAGARNRTTLAAEQLLDGEAQALTQKVIELAQKGDITAIRLCFDRILPRRRERLLSFDMPALASAMDARKAIAAIIEAVAAAEITPGEARELTKLVEAFDKAIAAEELDERLRILEEKTGVTRS